MEKQIGDYLERDIPKSCEECGKPETDQALVESHAGVNEYWCLDCMRLAGRCLSCGKDIRLLVEDYFTYDDDICPDCITKETLNP